jgi:hypothetical protein
VGQIRAILASWNAIERPSAPAVASEMGLKPRTLNRLLSKEGTSFIRLLKDARYESAQRLESSAPIYQSPGRKARGRKVPFRAFRRCHRQHQPMAPSRGLPDAVKLWSGGQPGKSKSAIPASKPRSAVRKQLPRHDLPSRRRRTSLDRRLPSSGEHTMNIRSGCIAAAGALSLFWPVGSPGLVHRRLRPSTKWGIIAHGVSARQSLRH